MLSVSFQGFSVEYEPYLREFIAHHTPNLEHWSDFLALDVEHIWRKIVKGGFSAVLMAGGPPCQPWSALGQQQQWSDPRSCPLIRFFEFRDQLGKKCRAHGIALHWMMEEVGSLTHEAILWISELAGCMPFLLHAADFGWLHRARFFWTSADAASFESLQRVEVHAPGSLLPLCHVVRWVGDAVPGQWSPEGNLTWVCQGECGRRGPVTALGPWAPSYSSGRLLTLTTCFEHPCDRGNTSDVQLVNRFYQDKQRFPLAHYCVGNLVGTSVDDLRPISTLDRERLMGFPDHFTEYIDSTAVPARMRKGENRRLSALGNAWHVPSALLVLAACLGIKETPLSVTAAHPFDWPGRHAPNTVWAESWAPASPPSAENWFSDACSMLHDVAIPSELLADTLEKLQRIDMNCLARFDEWHHTRFGSELCGPDFEALISRHDNHINTGRQRSGAGCGAPDPLLPRDLTEHEHIEAALQLEHPFQVGRRLERDLLFSVEALATLGPSITK